MGTTGAFNFAQWYVHNYSNNWGQEPFDLETEFNIEISVYQYLVVWEAMTQHIVKLIGQRIHTI